MLCSVCNEREARIHLTQCIGESINKVDLCEVCGSDLADTCLGLGSNADQPPPLSDTINQIVDRNSRYPKKAYLFVLGAMQYAYERRLLDANVNPSLHLSASEIIDALLAHSCASFGANAKAVLNSWGIRDCTDFGAIISHLVEAKLIAKSSDDKEEDFQRGFDFHQAFPLS